MKDWATFAPVGLPFGNRRSPNTSRLLRRELFSRQIKQRTTGALRSASRLTGESRFAVS